MKFFKLKNNYETTLCGRGLHLWESPVALPPGAKFVHRREMRHYVGRGHWPQGNKKKKMNESTWTCKVIIYLEGLINQSIGFALKFATGLPLLWKNRLTRIETDLNESHAAPCQVNLVTINSVVVQGWTKITFPDCVNMRWNICVLLTATGAESAIISPLIHRTWEFYFSPALY